jgi:hypothetical protein
MDLVATGFGDAGLKALELIARCDAIDAILALNFLGVPSTGQEDKAVRSGRGGLDGFSPWERSFMELCAALMEETGKPIINVPDHHIEASAMSLGTRFSPVIVSSPQAAARALERMVWHQRYNG